MKRFLLALLFLSPACALAQSNPNFTNGTVLTAPVLNGAFAGKVDVAGGSGSAVQVNASNGTSARTLAAITADTANVLSFGADPTGTIDSEPAFAAAIASLPSAGGVIYAPNGTFIFNTSLIVTKSGVVIQGNGVSATTIKGALSLSSIIQEGNSSSTVINNAVNNIGVTRAAGSVPTGSIGIYWANFNYGSELKTLSQNSYYARAWDYIGAGPFISIGFYGSNLLAANVTQAYAHIVGVAGLFITNSEFGQNGGETYNPVYTIEVSGGANDISFTNSELLPRGPTPNSGTILGFTNYTNTTGIFKFTGITSENTAYFMASDASSPHITDMIINGSRISTATAFSNLNAASELDYATFASSQIGGGALNLTNFTNLSIIGGFIQGLTLVGSSSADSVAVTGTGFGNIALSGTFGTVSVVGVQQQTGATFTDSSTATTKLIQAPNASALGIGVIPIEPLHVHIATNENIGLFDSAGSPNLGAFTDAFGSYEPLLINGVVYVGGQSGTKANLVGVGTGSAVIEPFQVFLGVNENVGFFDNSGVATLGAFSAAFGTWNPLSLNSTLYVGGNGGTNSLKVGINTSSPGAALEVNGTTKLDGTLGIPQATWADNQTCTAGQVSVDASYVYVCTATNTVKRVALSTF